MPFGYTEYRLKEGVSLSTVKSQALVINQFFSFIDKRNKNKNYEINDITAKDVRQFLEQQKNEKKLTDFTVYRKQSNLKTFFDYLWKTGQINLDPLTKFNFFSETTTFTTQRAKETLIMYDYRDILQYEQQVLHSDKLSLTSKLLMIFYTKAIQLNDIFTLETTHFNEVYDQDKHYIVANYLTKQGREATITFTDAKEISILKEAFRKSKEKNTPYLISSYIKELGEYGPSSPVNKRYYVNALNQFLGLNLRSEHIRIVYVHYLIKHEGKSVEEVADILGRSDKNIAQLLAEGIERIKINSYNVQMELVF